MTYSLCFTGHRLKGLRKYNLITISKKLEEIIHRAYATNVKTFIFGGAVGIDQMAMKAGIYIKRIHPDIELVGALPFPSQPSVWPAHIQEEYWQLIKQMSYYLYVNKDPYSTRKMQTRNEWMVDNSNYIIAIFNGLKGGTQNCINYAKSKRKTILIVHPETLTETWIKGDIS